LARIRRDAHTHERLSALRVSGRCLHRRRHAGNDRARPQLRREVRQVAASREPTGSAIVTGCPSRAVFRRSARTAHSLTKGDAVLGPGAWQALLPVRRAQCASRRLRGSRGGLPFPGCGKPPRSQSGRKRAQIMSHSIRVSSVRRSLPGAKGGLAMVIRNRLPSIPTLYLRGSPVISLGFL
jgi:hypothetical protein